MQIHFLLGISDVTGLAGLQHQGLENQYIGESKARELRGKRGNGEYISVYRSRDPP